MSKRLRSSPSLCDTAGSDMEVTVRPNSCFLSFFYIFVHWDRQTRANPAEPKRWQLSVHRIRVGESREAASMFNQCLLNPRATSSQLTHSSSAFCSHYLSSFARQERGAVIQTAPAVCRSHASAGRKDVQVFGGVFFLYLSFKLVVSIDV